MDRVYVYETVPSGKIIEVQGRAKLNVPGTLLAVVKPNREKVSFPIHRIHEIIWDTTRG